MSPNWVNGDEGNCCILFNFLCLTMHHPHCGGGSSPLAQLVDLMSPFPDAALIKQAPFWYHQCKALRLKFGGHTSSGYGDYCYPEAGSWRNNMLHVRMPFRRRDLLTVYEASQRVLWWDWCHMCAPDVSSPRLGFLTGHLPVPGASRKKEAHLTMQLVLNKSAELLSYGSLQVFLPLDVASKTHLKIPSPAPFGMSFCFLQNATNPK
jgi:hypothetical protein